MNWQKLHGRFKIIGCLEHGRAILEWDRYVMMPTGAAEASADALETIEREIHGRVAAPEIPDLVEAARAEDLDPWQEANLREIERRWIRTRAIPADLVAALSRATSACELAWRQARADNNWRAVADKLEVTVALTREKAAAIAHALGTEDVYDALLGEHEPGLTRSVVGPVFGKLRATLPRLIDAAIGRQSAPLIAEGPFPKERQEAVVREVVAKLGFDFTRGRLDESAHPMTAGVPDDTRITTRYEDDWVFSFYAGVHEAAHGLYQQRLPAAWRGQPVGEAAGVAMHESQSLLFEKQVGRSDFFLDFAAPILQRHLCGRPTDTAAWRPGNLSGIVRRVARNLIRVEADEISYSLHVILRYDLETALIDGTLDVSDLPEAWDEEISKSLGVSTAGDDRNGILQDIHWYAGMFGYFPMYTVGAIWAAQLYKAARAANPGLEDAIRAGEFGMLVDWLQSHVHRLGRSAESSLSIMSDVTGSPLDPDVFLEHLRLRYGS